MAILATLEVSIKPGGVLLEGADTTSGEAPLAAYSIRLRQDARHSILLGARMHASEAWLRQAPFPENPHKMGKLIRLSDVHGFENAALVPEAAVTASILANVAKINEGDQLEPWVQSLLHDPNETPHGPTEIADILTTRTIVNGRRCFTALVLKGKATPKLSSRQVSHQFFKLRQLDGLDVAGLLGVGDIQDDAQRDFVQTAIDIGCDYFIADRVDVARLLIAYGFICSEDGLPFTDGKCDEGHKQRQAIDLHYKLREEPQCELVRLSDVSHGTAKRLSGILLVDRHYSRDLIPRVVKTAVNAIKTDPYVRSELVKARWGTSPAHVVWVYLGQDLADVTASNWLCRACWIDPELDAASRPGWDGAEPDADGVSLVWNPSYAEMKRLLADHGGGKAGVIDHVEGMIRKMDPIIAELGEAFSVAQEAGSEASLVQVMKTHAESAESLYLADSDGPLPPAECRDYYQCFQSAMAHFQNLFLYYTADVFLKRNAANRISLFNMSWTELERELMGLGYEREKLHRG